MNNDIWNSLTNQYSLSKTLRFELKPITIDKEGLKISQNFDSIKKIIDEDQQRNEDFKKVKKIADEYFKDFIEKSLSYVKISRDNLDEFQIVYFDFIKDKLDKKKREGFEKEKNKLRSNLKKLIDFKFKEEFSNFFKKEFYEKILPQWLEEQNRLEEKKLVEKFKGFTTYFTGFNSNRENMFTDKNIPTSIFYRIVDDNLPKYIFNLQKFNLIYEISSTKFDELEVSLRDELNGLSLLEYLSIQNFNSVLNQSGIEHYNKKIIGAINSKINELIQRDNSIKEDKDKLRTLKKSKLQALFNQILSDKHSLFEVEKLNSDLEVLTKSDEFYNSLLSKEIFDKFSNLFNSLDSQEFDLNLIKIKNGKFISDISQQIFGEFNTIKVDLRNDFIRNNYYNVDKLNKKQEEEIEKYLKKEYFTFQEIQNSILRIKNNRDDSSEIKSLFQYFKEFEFSVEHKKINLLKTIEEKYKLFNSINFKKFEDSTQKKLTQDNYVDVVNTIKDFLDSLLQYYHFTKLLHYTGEDRDEDFYKEYDELLDNISQITSLYNKIRNYITQKPFSNQKFKLNFEKSTLADGWDLNKERQNLCVIFRKNSNYYLGIINKEDTKIFVDIKEDLSDEYFEKMEYKLLPGASKMLPKVFFSKSNIDYYKPNDEILRIRNTSSYTKGGDPQKGFSKFDFNIDDCRKMIDFYIISLNKHPEWKDFNFKFRKLNEYNSIDEFYREVEEQGFKLNFKKINQNYIKQLVEENKLYLFQIYNKDFSQNKIKKENYNSNKNLHTIYFEELFSKENLDDVVFKLNGQAEIFYRKKSIKYSQEVLDKGHHYDELKDKFNYPIIKNKRYTQDKVLFHVPITINFKSNSRVKINNEVNKIIQKNHNSVNILSLDRGERHLLYYTLLDNKGNILDKGTFNLVNDKFNKGVNYHQKLSVLEKERDENRKSWQNISTIKELKEGFLSQIIHKISKIAVKNNAVIVLEDLNYGFKRGRFKVEKQVYEKFEKMLISKLNFLMFKDKESDEVGGSLKAYQLAPQVNVLKDIGKQTGILFYVEPYLTSKICPKTGFVNRLYPKYENETQARDFFKKFDSIRYLEYEDLFEFSLKYSSFGVKDLVKDDWKIYSNGIKLVQNREKSQNNNWVTKEVDVNEELKKLFNDFNIDISNSKDLVDDITNQNKFFLESLIRNLKLILQLRNSYTDNELNTKKISEKDGDFILSCVKDKEGNFFDSRITQDSDIDNADCNGAYHIGMKGLMVLNKIKEFDDIEKLKFNDLKIERQEFLNEMIMRNWGQYLN